jgi:hypothetical protein
MSSRLDLNTEVWIDQYLRRELSPQATEQFEQRMRDDADFLNEVILRRDIIVGIRVAEDRLLRERLEHISQAASRGEAIPSRSKTHNPRILLWGGILLAALVTAVVLIWKLA